MQAVILAAGQGKRLRPLTDSLPKCLVPVNGKPILQYQLECLERCDIDHCVIVVGYRDDQLRHYFGPKFRNVHITYIYNKLFEQTNNIVSLWLACQELDDDVLLLEGDLLFEEDLLRDLTKSPYPDVAVVAEFQPSMNGTIILADNGVATSMILKSEQGSDFDYRDALKTVNLYSLSQYTMHQRILPVLDRYVTSQLTDQYYEVVLAQLIAQGDWRLDVLLTKNRLWAEIDTQEDLQQAERLFR
jgi:choline kinase